MRALPSPPGDAGGDELNLMIRSTKSTWLLRYCLSDKHPFFCATSTPGAEYERLLETTRAPKSLSSEVSLLKGESGPLFASRFASHWCCSRRSESLDRLSAWPGDSERALAEGFVVRHSERMTQDRVELSARLRAHAPHCGPKMTFSLLGRCASLAGCSALGEGASSVGWSGGAIGESEWMASAGQVREAQGAIAQGRGAPPAASRGVRAGGSQERG